MKISKIPLDGIFKNLSISERGQSDYVFYDRADMHVAWPTQRIKVRRDLVDISSISDFELMLSPGFFCGGIKRGRHERYEQIVSKPSYKGPYGLSEGDSWHLYPFLIEEIVDQFIHAGKDSLAVWSTDCTGDTLKKIWDDRNKLHEYMNYLFYQYRNRKPTFMLLSGGGNDLLNNGRLYVMLKDYQAGMGADEIVDMEQIKNAVSSVMSYFDLILAELAASYPALRIFIHGYDYLVPMDDIWIGIPMRDRGILDKSMQRQVVRVFVDYYNIRLSEKLKLHPNAVYVDVRDTVRDEDDWHDEIHPKSRGFAEIAKKIRNAVTRSIIS